MQHLQKSAMHTRIDAVATASNCRCLPSCRSYCVQQEAPKQRQAAAGRTPVYGYGADSPDPAEPRLEPPDAHASSGGPSTLLWWPQAEVEKQQQLLRLWTAGVRLPEQIPEPPTAAALQQAEMGARADEGVVVGPTWPVQTVQHQQQFGVHPGPVLGLHEQQPQGAGYAPQEGTFLQTAEGTMQQVVYMQPPYGGWTGYEMWYPAQQ